MEERKEGKGRKERIKDRRIRKQDGTGEKRNECNGR
jgi:hypothetical protein